MVEEKCNEYSKILIKKILDTHTNWSLEFNLDFFCGGRSLFFNYIFPSLHEGLNFFEVFVSAKKEKIENIEEIFRELINLDLINDEREEILVD